MALPGTGVVKQLDHTRTQPIPQWVEQLTRNFDNIGLSIPLVKGSFRVRDFKQARPKVAILKPGEDWQIAHLHLHTQLTLRYPIESSGDDTKNSTG